MPAGGERFRVKVGFHTSAGPFPIP